MNRHSISNSYSPPLMAVLSSVADGFKHLDTARRRHAEAHVRANNGPGHTDHVRLTWQPVSGGTRCFGTLAAFVTASGCNRFELEVDLAVAARPFRPVTCEGFSVEMDLRQHSGRRC